MKRIKETILLILLVLVCLAAVPVGIFAKGEIKNQASETSNDIKSLEKLNSSELKINHETLDISLERSERLKVTNAEDRTSWLRGRVISQKWQV